ncbi:MAG: MFS transporter [Rhodospirillales bacterium]|nr:MFS transporter [Rhodospirillales bacterium]
MPFRLAPLLPVLLGLVCAQGALGIMTPLIPLLLLRGGASSAAIGAVASAYYVGFLGGALTCERVVTRVGHIRAFAVFAAIAADAALLLVFGQAPWPVALLRLCIGYASSGMLLVVESWLNDRADSATRGRVFGAYLVASWGAAAAGPLALNVVAAEPVLFVLVGLLFATAVLPLALTQQANPAVRPQAHFALGRLYRVSPVGVACCLASGLVNGAFYSLVPVFLQRSGYGAGSVAGFISAAMAAGLLVQYPVGLLSDRIGRRPVMVGTIAAAFLLALALGLAGRVPFAATAALGFCFAGMTAPLYGLGAGQTNDRMQRGDYVAASGGLLFVWSLGSSVSPSVAGLLMGRAGPPGLFGYLALVLAALGLFTGARMLLRGEVPRAQRTAFVPAPSAPPRHSELASRAASPFWRTLLHRRTREMTD